MVGRRAVVILAVVIAVAIIGVASARAWAFAADRQRRIQESVVREVHLYRELANRDAVLESQRRIYMERFRRLEGQLRARDQDVFILRERLGTHAVETKVQ